MGSGSWSPMSFSSYVSNSRGVSVDDFTTGTYSNQDVFKSTRLAKELDPMDVTRECRDSEEHPETLPVILALDVTGSMGDAAVKVAQKLNDIMTDLYEDNSVKDIEFCIMGIGDLACDRSPIQISQFESDIRIAEQLDKVYFEFGGGGNKYESYTAAWYMGTRHCDLDCWKRGKKGIIITMGDECPNPYLPGIPLITATGDHLQDDIETKDLLEEVTEKFDVYHISVDDRSSSYEYHQRFGIDEKWENLLGDHYKVATLDSLSETITDIITSKATPTTSLGSLFSGDDTEVVSW